MLSEFCTAFFNVRLVRGLEIEYNGFGLYYRRTINLTKILCHGIGAVL
jgi:hypothetical protein